MEHTTVEFPVHIDDNLTVFPDGSFHSVKHVLDTDLTLPVFLPCGRCISETGCIFDTHPPGVISSDIPRLSPTQLAEILPIVFQCGTTVGPDGTLWENFYLHHDLFCGRDQRPVRFPNGSTLHPSGQLLDSNGHPVAPLTAASSEELGTIQVMIRNQSIWCMFLLQLRKKQGTDY